MSNENFLSALQKIQVALGGESGDAVNIIDSLIQIADAIEKGEKSGSLPDVSDKDNGKILIVANGKWILTDNFPARVG